MGEYAVLRSDGRYCHFYSCVGDHWDDLAGALTTMAQAIHRLAMSHAFGDKSAVIVGPEELGP